MKARELLVRPQLTFEMRWVTASPGRTIDEETEIRSLIYALIAYEELIDDAEIVQHIRPLRQMMFLSELAAPRIGVSSDKLACNAAIEATRCLTRYLQGKSFSAVYLQPGMREYVDRWHKWVEEENERVDRSDPVEAP